MKFMRSTGAGLSALLGLSIAAFGVAACQSEAGTTALATAPSAAFVEPAASPEKIEEYISWLADDAREGREAGTPGFDAAADYVAAKFDALGLEPAGDDGAWFQQVPLRGVTRDLEAQAMSVEIDGEATALTPMVDFMMGSSAALAEAEVTAPAVFVGYGVIAPEFGIDDYAGIDAEGKIVIAFGGMPDGLPSEEAAHYGANKYTTAAAQGAVGYITVSTNAYDRRSPWDRITAMAGSTGVTWITKDGKGFDDADDLVATARMSTAGAEKLFAGADRSFADLRAEADTEGQRPAAFDLPVTITMKAASLYEDLASKNVIGLLPGSDPELADEYVVLTAHLDHVGIRTNVDPEADNINNGALDNASGVAIMLEEARLFLEAAANGKPPRRSILFIALTAEEKGLIGSEYFAYNPTVPLEDIVADVNLDMPLITYDFIDVIAWGSDHSSLGATVDRAAASMDIALIPDPIPEMSIFTRSDHYRFVQQGIPSVFLFTGFGNGGEEAFNSFMSTNYHRPSDDLSQPLDFNAGAKFATLNYRIAREIADADERPTWNEGDFFGELYGRD